jgi:translocation and assembly module TamA
MIKYRRIVDRGGIAALLAVLHCSVGIADVVVEGLDGELEANARALMRLDDQPCDAPTRRVEAEFDAAQEEIQLALEAYGFYDASVDAALEFSGDCWQARFVVSPGERVLLRDVQVELRGDARTDAAFDALLAQSEIVSAQPLLHGDYDALKQALRALAIERGYRDAQFTQSTIDVYPSELSADVSVVFDSGQRYRFGEIEIDDGMLDRDLLFSYIDPARGQYYDSRALTDARLELINSGYFDGVFIEPGVPDAAAMEIPVRIRLTPAARAQVSYGFGLSTDTGPRFRFGRSIRRLNSAGHQLNVNGLFSPVVIEASANYRLPYGDPRSEWISFDVGGIREDTDTSTSRSLQLGARRVVTQSRIWTRTDLLSMIVEDFDIGSQSGRSRLLTPGVEFIRLDADDAIRPNRGSRLSFELRGASDALGSDTSFAQMTAAGKWIWPLLQSSRLLIRTEVGRVWFDEFTDLPPSVRYFAGGDHSVRGYDFETLGALNELGEVIGGSRLFTASVEFEKQIRPAWSIAFFTDVGNAFLDSNADLSSSAGLGARWRSPLGPVRIDLAKPHDGPDRDVRLHITLGPDL